jgi:hypothetical protein
MTPPFYPPECPFPQHNIPKTEFKATMVPSTNGPQLSAIDNRTSSSQLSNSVK